MTVRAEKKQNRKNLVPARLAQLRRLRGLGSPKWVIKSAQIALVLNRAGLKHVGIGKDGNSCQSALYAKYVVPLLEGNEDDIL